MDNYSGNKEYNIYRDIRNRTNGEIYLGIVGPVRTGKSTFIKRFMELMVLPFMEGEAEKERAMDELPQAAAGKTIMTTEPKFIPQQAAEIRLSDFKTEEEPLKLRVRLIDCVGFLADGAVGHMEGNGSRMVKTPWSDQEIPFAEAASIGTEKVIRDHATIGIVVTTDGTIGELARENYINAEERTVQELKNIGKPFVILLNSAKPYAQETIKLASEMEKKYQTTAVPVNCEQLRREDVLKILESVLYIILDAFYVEHPFNAVCFGVNRFCARACARRKDSLLFLHNLYIIDAFLAGMTIADIFKIANHIFLAIHIIRLHAHSFGVFRGNIKHFLQGFRRCHVMLCQFLSESGCTLDRKRMHRYVIGCQLHDFFHGIADICGILSRQTQNQIHIDILTGIKRPFPDSCR